MIRPNTVVGQFQSLVAGWVFGSTEGTLRSNTSGSVAAVSCDGAWERELVRALHADVVDAGVTDTVTAFFYRVNGAGRTLLGMAISSGGAVEERLTLTLNPARPVPVGEKYYAEVEATGVGASVRSVAGTAVEVVGIAGVGAYLPGGC